MLPFEGTDDTDPFLGGALGPRSAFYQLSLVSQLQTFLGRKDLATVLHVLVTARIDHYNVLCADLLLKSAQKLQNAAARILNE